MKRWSWLYILGAGVALGLPFAVRSDYWITVINQAGVYLVLTLSLNVVLGYCGQLSLATAAFWALGAYCTALLTTRVGLNGWLCLPLSGLFAAAAALPLGVASLRVRGHYLAMTTIGFGEIVRLVLMNWTAVTGGANGVVDIPPLRMGSVVLDTPLRFYYLVLLGGVAFAAFCYRLRTSRFGRALVAIKDAEVVAECFGINAMAHKVTAFAISAFLAGVAGWMYASMYQYVNPNAFVFAESVKVMCMLFIGGSGTVAGSVVGALVLTVLPEALRFLQRSYMMVYGGGVALMMVVMPQGIVGLAQRLQSLAFPKVRMWGWGVTRE